MGHGLAFFVAGSYFEARGHLIDARSCSVYISHALDSASLGQYIDSAQKQ